MKRLIFVFLFIPSLSWGDDNLDGTYLFCDNPKYNHIAWQTGYEFKGKSKYNKDYPDENYYMHHDLIQYNISLNTDGEMKETFQRYIAYPSWIQIFNYNYIKKRFWIWEEFDRYTLEHIHVHETESSFKSNKICSVVDSKKELINRMNYEFQKEKKIIEKNRKI